MTSDPDLWNASILINIPAMKYVINPAIALNNEEYTNETNNVET